MFLRIKVWLEEQGYDVDILSRCAKKDSMNINFVDIFTSNPNDYDEIYIVSTNLDFPGGVVNNFLFEKVRFLNKFKDQSKIFWYLVDPLYNLSDFGTKIKDRLHGKKPLKIVGKYEKELSIKECELFSSNIKKWTILFSGFDYKKYESSLNDRKKYLVKTDNFINEPYLFRSYFKDRLKVLEEGSSIFNYDWSYYSLPNKNNRSKILNEILNKSEYDLNGVYIGNVFKLDSGSGSVKNYPMMRSYDLIYHIKSSVCTIIIGDDAHNDNWVTFRLYESIIFGTLPMIYSDFDSKRRIFKDPEIKKYCYFNSYEELKENINLLKDFDLRNNLTKKIKSELFNI